MRASGLTLTAAVLAALAAGGCKDKAKSISDADYLLNLQHQTWTNARETLQGSDPELSWLRKLQLLLTSRTPRRVEMDYTGSNKQEVLDKLASLGKAFEDEVISKLNMTQPEVRLRPGVTMEQLRDAFMKLDDEYLELQAITSS